MTEVNVASDAELEVPSPAHVDEPGEVHSEGYARRRESSVWCSGWCSRWWWQLVRDYHPDPAVPWRTVSFARHSLLRTYKDPAVEAEFLRFMCREFIDLVLAAVWFGSGPPFVTMLGYPGTYPGDIHQYATLWHLPVFLVSAYCILLAPQTVTGAWFKEKVMLAVVFGTCITGSFQSPAMGFFCERGVDPLRQLLGMAQEVVTPERKQQYCVEVVCPFATATSALPFLFIRLRLLPMLVLSVMFLTALFAGYSPAVLPGTYKDSVVAQQVSVYLVAHTVTLFLVVIRDHLLRQQFEQAIATYARTLALEEQQRHADHFLCAMLPQSVLPRLMAGVEVSDNATNATVMFSDVVSFTTWSASRTPSEVVHMLNYLCVRFDALSEKHRIEKVKTIGDAYWAVAGLPVARPDHADVICLFALDCQKAVKSAARKHAKWADVVIRIGVHSGDLAGGILGRQSMSYEVFGTTSHHAEQVEQAAEPGEVLVTAATRDELTDDLFLLIPRAPVYFRGRTEPTETFALVLTYVGQVRGEDDGVSAASSAWAASSDASVSSQGEAARVEREVFLRRQLSGKSAGDAGGEASSTVSVASAAKMAEDVSRRKFRFIILTFADDAIEAQFVAFTLERQRPLRFMARCCLFAVCAALVILLLADIGSLPAPSAVIFTASLVACALLVATSARGVLNRWADFVLFAAVCLGCFVGAGISPRAVVGNDMTYLNPMLGALLAVGLPTVPTLVVTWGFVLCVSIPNLVFAYTYAVYRGPAAAYNSLAFLIVFLAALLAERLSRKQFVEHHVATLLQKGVEHQRELQESLVASIVPRHVVRDLMAWFRDGRDIEKSIAQPLDVAVAFLQFVRSDVPLTSLHRMSAVEVMRLVRAVHDAADDELEKVKSHVAKIKTVGDVALLAGPFSRDVTLEDAGLALVVVGIRLRRRVAPNVSLRCGFHVGPVVGAVVGTDRLCYDIFGDTVNTASRTMTAATANEADLIATAAFVELFPSVTVSGSADIESCGVLRGPSSGSESSDVQFEFDEAKVVLMKGKGSVKVHVVRDIVLDA